MPTDPRYVVRCLLDPDASSCALTRANMLWADGLTPANVEADYAYNPVIMERLMTAELPHPLDGIFIITEIGDDPPDGGGSGPVCFNHRLGVQTVTINKYNDDGSIKVNGDTLARQMQEEVRRIIQENPYGSLRRTRGGRPGVTPLATSLIYGDTIEILYKQYAALF